MAEPRRILTIKLADLGDLLTATPALRALRLSFPTAKITALVTPHTACLLEGNDAVDDTLIFPKALFDRPSSLVNPLRAAMAMTHALRVGARLRAGRFDTVVLLHHLTTAWGAAKYRALLAACSAETRVGLARSPSSIFTAQAVDHGFGVRHEVDYWLEVAALAGAHHPDPRMELHLTPEERAGAASTWQGLDPEGRPRLAIHPGSGAFSLARRWPADKYAALGDAFAARGFCVVLIAGKGEETLVRTVQQRMEGRSSILGPLENPRLLAAHLQSCTIFVGNDSGVMHCAAAMAVPTLGVFGLSNHLAWGPYPPREHAVVRLDLPCSPCFYRAHSLGTPGGCAERSCLVDLAPGAVVEAALDLLRRSSRSLPAPRLFEGVSDGQ